MKSINVFVHDKSEVVIKGIVSFLSPVTNIIGSSTSFSDVTLVCKDPSPKVIIMGVDSFDLKIRKIRNIINSNVKNILYIPEHIGRCLSKEVINYGVSGVISRTSPPEYICNAIKACSTGDVFIDPNIDMSTGSALTSREKQIIYLIGSGKNNQEIADILYISKKTVDTHRLNLMKKLDVHNSFGLFRVGVALGLIDI